MMILHRLIQFKKKKSNKKTPPFINLVEKKLAYDTKAK